MGQRERAKKKKREGEVKRDGGRERERRERL